MPICSRRFPTACLTLAVWALLGADHVRAAPCTDQYQLVFDPSSGAFLTSDTVFLPVQEGFNCYAWQTFIAMNWPVDPGWPANPALAGEPDRKASVSTWGVPPASGRPMTSATVWESFKPASTIFLPRAAKPTGWGIAGPKPSGCSSDDRLLNHVARFSKVLADNSKSPAGSAHGFKTLAGTAAVQPDEIMEATGGWLTDQRSKLVFFERLVGKAEFDYIMSERLYDAVHQKRVATNADGEHPEGLSLPKGVLFRPPHPATPQAQEDLGAIEIKAAWRVLTGHTEIYDRYLTAVAWLKRPDTGDCTQEVIGLVGLHIIHKTPSKPDFVWSTFEQVDNVPETPGATPPSGGFSFNNPDCTGSDCTPNVPRVGCTGSGPYNACKDRFPRDQPVQVTRVQQPTDDTLKDLNANVQAQIKKQTGGKSVFQYYNLVNVLWDVSPTPPMPEPGAEATVPLRYGTFQSQSSLKVVNTTLETYIQDESCDFCHKFATIAGRSKFASDFSFLFMNAASSKP